MHLDDERVERLRDGEGSSEVLAADRRHAAGCPECAARLSRATAEAMEVQGWLTALDPPATPAGLAGADVAAALRSTLDAAYLVPAQAAPPAVPRPRRQFRRVAAAAAALAAVAGAGFALPGSPLRAWVVTLLAGSPPAERAPAPMPPPEPAPEARVRSGVSVPADDGLVVRFSGARRGGGIVVRLTEGNEVTVTGPPGAATYASQPGRLVVDNSGSMGTFEIAVPRDAPRVEVRIGERRVYVKTGPRVAAAVDPRADGAWVVPFAP